jgi:hypothetical protein
VHCRAFFKGTSTAVPGGGRTSQILEGLVSFCQDLLYLASRQNTAQI